MTDIRLPIAIVGASGLVGQKAIELIKLSSCFTLTEVSTSKKHLGECFSGLTAKEPLAIEAPYVLSALPAEAAAEIEPLLLARGQHVFSNASTFRMKEDIPLLIPEINLPHIELVERQTTKGKLICNPNCMVALLAPLLAPLIEKLSHIHIVTMQAISGAGKGYALENNIIPNIAFEEAKIERELQKIFNSHHFSISVHVHRVPIVDGHSCVLQMHGRDNISVEELTALYKMNPLYKLYDDPFSPQPGRDLTPYDAHIHIGRIKQQGQMISLFGMIHNLVRGAAYGALLNAQAFLERENRPNE